MKKSILCLAGIFALASGAFAVDFGLSVGGGFTFSGAFTTSETEMAGNMFIPGAGSIPMQIESDQKGTDLNYGGFLFFDATYGEFYLSVSGGSGDLVNTSTTTGLGAPITQDPSYPKTATSSLGIGLLGKYPFQLQKFTLFPLAGIEYQVFFTGAYKDDYTTDAIETKASDFNTLWFRAGGGVDYALTESLYIRLEGLYGFKLAPTEFDKNSENYVEGGGPLPSMGATGTGGDVKSGWVNTVTLKLGVGYKF